MVEIYGMEGSPKIKILQIIPNRKYAKGGMLSVALGIENSNSIHTQYEVSSFEAYMHGFLPIRIAYMLWRFFVFNFTYKKYDLFLLHTASNGGTWRNAWYLNKIKKTGKKGIIHIHGPEYIEFYEELNEKKKKKVREFLSSGEAVIALSDYWKYEFENHMGLTNCISIPNGVDVNDYTEARTSVTDKANVFLMMGELGKRKGTFDLLSATKIVAKEYPDVKVFLAGCGKIKKIKKLIEQKGLTQNVFVLGWVNHMQQIEVMKKSATIILPSYFEGLPMSILEGMASGKAIISTKVGSIPEVVKKENGILVEAGDVKALSEAMNKFINNPNMLNSMREANIERAEQEYSIEIMHKRMCSLFNAVLNK